jgi:predicted CXXCH cytochrome family protein
MGHLTRAVLIVVAVVLVVFVAPRLIPLPEVMQDFGFYFGQGDEDVWANRPAQYADSAECSTCHTDNSVDWQAAEHREVACETCHGPAQSHIDNVATLPVVDDSREFCGKCHETLLSRPAEFPQVDLAAHNPDTSCLTCHNPHHPAPGSVGASQKTEVTTPPTGGGDSAETPSDTDKTDSALPPIPHSLEGRADCLMCHGPQGFKPNPADHEGRTNETCLSCHRSDT